MSCKLHTDHFFNCFKQYLCEWYFHDPRRCPDLWEPFFTLEKLAKTNKHSPYSRFKASYWPKARQSMLPAVMSETGLRQDQDFQNHNPFFETGIKTLNTPIPFSILGSRLSICQSLFQTGIKTFKKSITFSRLGSRLIIWRGSQLSRLGSRLSTKILMV